MSDVAICECGASFDRAYGRGRPRVRCESCSPRQVTQKVSRGCEQCGVVYASQRGTKYCSARCRDKAKYLRASRHACAGCGLPTGTKRTDLRNPGLVFHRECRPGAEHGTSSRYSAGCRCDECRSAVARIAKEYRRRRVMDGRPIRRHGGSGPYIPERVRADVYERDGYVCQLCGEPTDPHAEGNDDMFPSLDHIVPQSLGGGHEDENLRTAHRVCNSSRGARVDVVAVMSGGCN